LAGVMAAEEWGNGQAQVFKSQLYGGLTW
jgi:hypothetical protein